MKRLPVIAFAALVLGTVAAFFLIQHLKVTTPLIAGNPSPFPPVINPLTGGACAVRTADGHRKTVSVRRTSVSFYLLNRSDEVDVYVVNQTGAIVDALRTGLFMRAAPHPVPATFTWNGREQNGRVAPPGMYYLKVVLQHQGRTIDITNSKGLLEWVTVNLSARCPRA